MGERKIGREAGAGEGKIGRETGAGEKDRQRDRGWGEREAGEKRRSNRGEREKITNTKKFVEFYLVVLHSAERGEALQWIVARQVSCYNPLSCFYPVTHW